MRHDNQGQIGLHPKSETRKLGAEKDFSTRSRGEANEKGVTGYVFPIFLKPAQRLAGALIRP